MREIDPTTGLALGTFGLSKLQDQDRSFHAIVRPNGEVIDISDRYPNSQAIYSDWARTFDALNDLNSRESHAGRNVGEFRPLPPTDYPQIFGAGSNYRKHAAEMYTYNKGDYQKSRLPGEDDESFYKRNLEFVEQRRAKGMPFIWLATHGSLVGANDDVPLPQIGANHDWEAELCLVLAGGAPRYMDPEEAHEHIAGYTIVNDMHTGELFSRDDIKWNADWIAKSPPGFKPVGPYVVPRQFFPDIDDLVIKLWVNGELKQDWPVNDMIFSSEHYVAYASERLKILPGDLLMTGSPPGNGAFHNQFLVPGDTMDIEISYLGRQRNRLVSEPGAEGRTPHYGLPIFDFDTNAA
ncbi:MULTISPECIES: fumarylacetoacetate hydrolase family protein [Sphingomonadales]|uniref:Fumarylacetoacetate (FAA) hydrolase n=1 Tax=Rhizorhabdus wittichii (strain DSM 6014 / CCUG 31198 / JCM 15750 / NBRC 105917 / EY 4224 / RW1) TaxID=392499 RepID=A0A9J9HAC4_RHIWR|nr:fumarylacetoacetate (FAA) hydrolase [Rhizorhabdus wittichii RW1]